MDDVLANASIPDRHIGDASRVLRAARLGAISFHADLSARSCRFGYRGVDHLERRRS